MLTNATNTNGTQKLTFEKINNELKIFKSEFKDTIAKCQKVGKDALENPSKIEVLDIRASKGKRFNLSYSTIINYLQEFNEDVMKNQERPERIKEMLDELKKLIRNFHSKFLTTKYLYTDLNQMMIEIYNLL